MKWTNYRLTGPGAEEDFKKYDALGKIKMVNLFKKKYVFLSQRNKNEALIVIPGGGPIIPVPKDLLYTDWIREYPNRKGFDLILNIPGCGEIPIEVQMNGSWGIRRIDYLFVPRRKDRFKEYPRAKIYILQKNIFSRSCIGACVPPDLLTDKNLREIRTEKYGITETHVIPIKSIAAFSSSTWDWEQSDPGKIFTRKDFLEYPKYK